MYPTRLMFLILALSAGTLALPPASHAECFCEYINGVLQPMCASSLELRPRCGTPVRAWSVPVPAPPLRLESCKPAMLCNRHGFCRPKWICD